MNTGAAGQLIESMTWDEVERRIAQGAIAILPIGAGAKQHGFHLPMNTDRIQAEWLASRLAERFEALIWPTITYGHYPAFVEFPGSGSLSASTFEALVREIAAAIIGYGCRALVVLDTGISTQLPIDRALSQSGNRNVLHLKAYDGRRYRRAARQLAEQSHGGHADELETSLMLALAPHLVDMPRAEASPALPEATPGPLTRTDTSSPNYSRSGSFGDPTLASHTKGEVLLAAQVHDLVEQVSAFIATTAAGNTALHQQRSAPS